MFKVLVSDKMDEDALKFLKDDSDVELTVKTSLSVEELKEEIKDKNAIIVRSATKVRKEIIDAAPNLKVIGRAGIGLDNIDVEYAKSKGIEVLNTPGASSVSVAELTLALILAVNRKIQMSVKAFSDKPYRWIKKEMKGWELHGKTLGIIGMGHIGREVAKRALCFGMKVIGYDVYDFNVGNVEKVQLDELYKRSDIITIHAPLLDSTRHMINSKSIAKMKDGVVLVCAARGGIIDEKSLIKSLKDGKVRAAALDVFEKEPPDENNELLKLDNVLLTPHIGGSTVEAQKRIGMEITDKVLKFLKGNK
jgi:D-3-phosphoglycerate dehydrogenase